MDDSETTEALRSLPPIDEILRSRAIANLRLRYPRFPWTRFIRQIVDETRQQVLEGRIAENAAAMRNHVIDRARKELSSLREKGMKRVINGTGVILHTNLGRAMLGRRLRNDITYAASHYLNLEFDLERGERSKRGRRMLRLIELATGAEASMVVNNNAAAVYLIANAFSPPGKIIVSRGELVEIGGSFRLPTILSDAAGEVLEVGTTNRTYVKDYAKEAREGDVLLKVHRSNYEIEGFAHEASLEELVKLAREKKCFCVYDLGSGAFYDFESSGLSGEEQVERVLLSGVDCVTMSGDKLLGGVQAGIILGKASFIDKLKRNPLSRAVRVDKITIAAVESLFRSYLFAPDLAKEIPVLSQALGPIEDLRKRATKIAGSLKGRVCGEYKISVSEDDAAIGGGSFSRTEIPGVAVFIECTSEKAAVGLAKKMRLHDPPLIPRVKGKELRFNLRSVPPNEDADLQKSLAVILGD